MAFADKIVGDEKFGLPNKRTRPRKDEEEGKAWDVYYDCVIQQFQITLNFCSRKYFSLKKSRSKKYTLVMTFVTGDDFTLDMFWSDMDKASFQQFANEYCVMCDEYFTSSHDLSLFRKFPAKILSGLEIDQIPTDF